MKSLIRKRNKEFRAKTDEGRLKEMRKHLKGILDQIEFDKKKIFQLQEGIINFRNLADELEVLILSRDFERFLGITEIQFPQPQ